MGPSCHDEQTLQALFEAGMTGVRLNLSHTTLAACAGWLQALHTAAARADCSPELLIDLRGPELRVGAFSEPIALQPGSTVRLGEGGVPVPTMIFGALEPGQKILLDDGALELTAQLCTGTWADCTVVRGGSLHPRKSIALPGCQLHPPTLTEQDLLDLAQAHDCGVTGVMLPFVRGREDLIALRKALQDCGAAEIAVFAKLEDLSGVQRLPDFLELADQIVIARGDLGNSMPLWELPAVQKQVAAACRRAGRPFMVVTQMLHSMQHNAVPTRAEVSDIFNAVCDGAASLMLTGETAAGQYPVQAMQYLVRTAEQAQIWLAAQH